MPEFAYTALRRTGEKVNGNLNAPTRAHACQMLEAKGLQPVSVNEDLAGAKGKAKSKPTKEAKSAPTAGAPGKPAAGGGSDPIFLTRGQLILFTEEVGDLLDAGLQLEQALRVMEGRRELGALQAIVVRLRQQVREGVSFSAALRNTSRSFGDLYCNLVAAGEVSGSLPTILRQQCKYLRTMDDLQAKVVSAMIYPSFIIAAGIGLMIVFMTILVPQLESLFEKTQQSVPFTTKMLIGMSDFFAGYWWAMAMAILAAAAGFYAMLQNPAGRLWWDEKKLSIWLYGPVAKAHFFAQFAHTLSNLVGNGIVLHKGLQLVGKATPNLFVRQRLLKVTDLVGEGGLLSRSMDRVGWFPALLIDMVGVGEQTGDLPLSLEKIATRFDKELNVKIQRLTTLIQPVIIIIMAFMVGVVVYSILAGIFQAIQGIRG
jgi:type II secretory pathway component PulF